MPKDVRIKGGRLGVNFTVDSLGALPDSTSGDSFRPYAGDWFWDSPNTTLKLYLNDNLGWKNIGLTDSAGTPAVDASFQLLATSNSSSNSDTHYARAMNVSTTYGDYNLAPPDATNGDVTVNGAPMYVFTIPGLEPFNLRCYQAQGAGGNNVTNGGKAYYFDVTVTPTVPDSKIYMRPGQKGYRKYFSPPQPNDVSGGSGGLGQVWIQDANGSVTASDGNNVTGIIRVAGSGGGNDAGQQGYTTYGTAYTSITSQTSDTGVTNSNGTTYSIYGTSYGGYPNGRSGGVGVTYTLNSANVVNTTYCSNVSTTTEYAGYASYYQAEHGKFQFSGKVVPE